MKIETEIEIEKWDRYYWTVGEQPSRGTDEKRRKPERHWKKIRSGLWRLGRTLKREKQWLCFSMCHFYPMIYIIIILTNSKYHWEMMWGFTKSSLTYTLKLCQKRAKKQGYNENLRKRRNPYRIQWIMRSRYCRLCLQAVILFRTSLSISLKTVDGGISWWLCRALFRCFQMW